MNIALIGYGNMGRAIESAAPRHGHTVIARFTSSHPLTNASLRSLQNLEPDCCIDFSHPAAVRTNVEMLAPSGIPLVEGTTGWYGEKNEIFGIVEENGGTMVYGSNFSAGAMMFFRIVERASQLMNDFDAYDVSVSEMHHVQKKDSPSGTAVTLADIITRTIHRKRTVKGRNDLTPIRPHELAIASARVGSVFGRHSVLFTSASDEIELSHRAHSRDGFAHGAILAAELVHNISGVCSFDELLFERSLHHSYV